jgi:hypothetical protein
MQKNNIKDKEEQYKKKRVWWCSILPWAQNNKLFISMSIFLNIINNTKYINYYILNNINKKWMKKYVMKLNLLPFLIRNN